MSLTIRRYTLLYNFIVNVIVLLSKDVNVL